MRMRARQVCALQWNRHEREILSSHGYSQNQLCLWKYPTMARPPIPNPRFFQPSPAGCAARTAAPSAVQSFAARFVALTCTHGWGPAPDGA